MTHSTEFDADQPDEDVGATAHSSRSHHERLWAALVDRADRLTAAADGREDDRQARSILVKFLHGDVLAHLQTEAGVVYQEARSIGAEHLVATLETDHKFMLKLVEEIEQADTEQEAARCARALVVLIALRIEKEEAIVLPALAEAGVDVNTLLEGVVAGMATDYDARFTYL